LSIAAPPNVSALARLPALAWPAVGVALVASRLWVLQGPYPTGIDGGNWLLFGRMLLGADTDGPGHSAHIYPPLIPLLMGVGDVTIGGLLSARLLGVASIALFMVAMHVALVGFAGVRPWAATVAAVQAGASFPLVSRLCNGGFPQNFGVAFGLVALCAAARAVETRAPAARRWATIALVFVALSHHAYYLWTLCALAALAVLPRPEPGAARVLLRIGLPSALAFAPTAVSLWSQGYAPPINALHLSFVDAVGLAGFGESGWRLLPAVAVGLYALHRGPRDGARAVWCAGGAMTALGLWSTLATGEPRMLALVCAGAGLGCGVGLERLARHDRPALACAVALVATAHFLAAADREANQEFERLRVVDGAYVQAADWITARAPAGLVFVNADRNGFPVAWWLAGLSRARVAAGSQPSLLAFPGTRRLATRVGEVFTPGRAWPQAEALARSHGVELLVTRKADFPDWIDWARERRPAFANASFVAFEVSPAP
jgi:hypothetical protein